MRVAARLGLCIAAVLCLWSPDLARAQEVTKLTERDAVDRFMRHDPRVRALEARVDRIQAEQADRARWSNPGLFYSREDTGDVQDAFVLIRQELPITGRLALFGEAGRLAVEAAQAAGRFQLVQRQAEVRHAFAALLLAQEREATLHQGLTGLKEVVRILRLRESEGEGSVFDRMRAEREVVDWDAENATAGVAVAHAQGRLAPYLGPDVLPASLVACGRLDEATPLPALETLLEATSRRRLDYLSTELSVAQFAAERRAAERRRLPTPVITAGSKRSAAGETAKAGYVLSVDLAIPLFDHGQGAATASRARMVEAEAEAASLRLQIEAEVRSAHAALRLRQEQAARYRQSAIETAARLVEIARLAYQEGELGILELLDTERQALQARLTALELAARVRTAGIELDRVAGLEVRP